MLQAFLTDGETSKFLLQPGRALGDFGARRRLVYSLGLVQNSICQQLDRIAEIRNLFAHNFFDIQFADEEIAAKCEELDLGPLLDKKITEPRKRFVQAVLIASTQLLLLALEVEQRKTKDEKSFPYPNAEIATMIEEGPIGLDT